MVSGLDIDFSIDSPALHLREQGKGLEQVGGLEGGGMVADMADWSDGVCNSRGSEHSLLGQGAPEEAVLGGTTRARS